MFDVLVVGGGINGVGIARDAAGRGLKVALCEQHDLAAHTSSASSKLIHGGLRYLEHRAFGMVRKALAERQVLMRLAPHLVHPLPFVLPHEPHLRPAWMIRLGLMVYDRLAPRGDTLPRSRRVPLRGTALGAPLRDSVTRGFLYADAQVADARLVVLNALDAHERGACIWTRTTCLQAWREPSGWCVDLRDERGQLHSVQARMLVNATGPWASRFTEDISLSRSTPLRLVQGSHIVVPALHDHGHAYLLQQPDGRIVFVVPFEDRFSLIGTTDVDFDEDPARVRIDPTQRDYLCAAVNRSFRRQIGADDVLWSFSGVRPLLDDAHAAASAVTRDYRLDLDVEGAPLLNVLGGKLTTFRHLAEEAVDLLVHEAGTSAPAWTAEGPVLPGGDLGTPAQVRHWLASRWPWLPAPLAARWARSYGSRAARILGNAESLDALGTHFGADLHEAEVEYLYVHEWVRHVDDLLWRRTLLGLSLDAVQQHDVAQWLAARVARDPTPAPRFDVPSPTTRSTP